MLGRRGGFSKLLAVILILAVVVGIVVLGIMFSGIMFSEQESEAPQNETDASPPPQDSGSVEQDTDEDKFPMVIETLNGSVVDSYFFDNKLYIVVNSGDPEKNKSWAHLYIYDFNRNEFIDKILIEEDYYGKVGIYNILSVDEENVYFYSEEKGGFFILIPLVHFISQIATGNYNIMQFNLDVGTFINEYTFKPGYTMTAYKDKLIAYKIVDNKILQILMYSLKTGEVEIELNYEVELMEYITYVLPAYVKVEGDVLTAIMVAYEANFELERMRIFHIILRYDFIADALYVEEYLVNIIGAYGGIITSTGFIEGDTYYIFTAYNVEQGNNTYYNYMVEARKITDGSLIWEYSEQYFPGERNTTAYISSYAKDGVFYVSWTFFAAFKDGEKLFMKSPWGGKYATLTIIIIIPTEVVEGGLGFYEVGDDLYVIWFKNVKGSGINGLDLYKVTESGLEFVDNLLNEGYVGLGFYVFNNGLYFIGSHAGGGSVLVRLI